MRILAVCWGIFKMVILSALCIVAILIYNIFGKISRWLTHLKRDMTHYYGGQVLKGNPGHGVWFYPAHFIFEAILFILWLIITPARQFKDFTLQAIDNLA